ncbi:MAG: carbonic anhydrase family protein [Chitinophagaceae bacterium]|nr:carbonic anhydrase family protein [Chitinophagaceae bacterium]
MKIKITSALLLILFVYFTACRPDDSKTETIEPTSEWNYINTDWQNEGYMDCGEKIQSPININTNTTVKANIETILFQYNTISMSNKNTGHTVLVTLNPNSTSRIMIRGITFKLIQFHFHRKSEHTINGTFYPMELHLVHQDTVTQNITVLGFLIREGTENPFIKRIFDYIPAIRNEHTTVPISINISDIIPSNTNYYTYTGSLTTPPCTQGIQWIIFKETMEASTQQINTLQKLFPHGNARPLQLLNNRIILEKL